jgi:hypothetical protein
MAAVLLVSQEEHEEYEYAMRRERVFRYRSNPIMYMGDEELFSKYRLNRECIIDLILMN